MKSLCDVFVVEHLWILPGKDHGEGDAINAALGGANNENVDNILPKKATWVVHPSREKVTTYVDFFDPATISQQNV